MFRTRIAVSIGALICALIIWLAKAAAPQAAKAPLLSISPVSFVSGDKLGDFVIDSGEAFACPESREQLDKAIQSGAAMRASEFFARRDILPRPFFGELPVALCSRASDQLEVRKDFNWTNIQIKSPKQPEIFIVSAGSADNARRAMYEQAPPISYGQAPYWAVVYAGTTGSSPAAFVVDRVTIQRESAEILLYRPANGAMTRDMSPYWFCIPLGCLPDGSYTVNLRDANRDEVIATASVALRRATAKETEARNSAGANDQKLAARYFDKLKDEEHEDGAALQVHLERLAEFVHSADLTPTARTLLSSDIEHLGISARWEIMGMYWGMSNRQPHRELADSTPGKVPGLEVRRNSFDDSPEWQPSKMQLSDIWLCDGTDAAWYASATYRNVPEFNGALTAENPSPVQQKIARIWAAIQAKGEDRNGLMYAAFPAAGTIDDAIGTAYDVLVNGKTAVKTFSANDPMWAVLLARRSFLIRSISTRSLEDEIDHSKRMEFFVHTSAYIGKADDIKEPAPVTFALIPLGKPKGVQSVGVTYGCQSICGKPVTAGADPVYAIPPEMVLTDYGHCLSVGTGFAVTP